jgi:hypothetical protein
MRYFTPICLVQTALSIVLVSPLVSALSVTPRATTCNGHAELCERSFGNVTFVGAHNSYAVGVNNLATNQDYDVIQQLKDGIRMLQMQVHNKDGVIQLCHTSCALYNGGTLEDYLKKVKSWLDSNPNEVISLLMVNSDGFKPSDYDKVFQSSGIAALSYAPTTATLPAADWPTLGSLIDSGKRVLTFMDYGADYASVPYIIDEFTNIWETAFNVIDPAFDCNVNRTKGDTATQMFLINHFLDKLVLGQPAPFKEQANITNGVSGFGSLGQHVQTCTADHGRNPNFMLVDFYEFGGGSVFQVAASANGVTYNPTSPIATPLPDITASSTKAGSSSTGDSNAASSIYLFSQPMWTVAALGVGVIMGVASVF